MEIYDNHFRSIRCDPDTKMGSVLDVIRAFHGGTEDEIRVCFDAVKKNVRLGKIYALFPGDQQTTLVTKFSRLVNIARLSRPKQTSERIHSLAVERFAHYLGEDEKTDDDSDDDSVSYEFDQFDPLD